MKRHLLSALAILLTLPVVSQGNIPAKRNGSARAKAELINGRLRHEDPRGRVFTHKGTPEVFPIQQTASVLKQRLDSTISQDWDPGANRWTGTYKDVYLYNNNGRQTEYIVYTRNTTASRWDPESRNVYTFNAAGNIATSTAYERDNGVWVEEYKEEFTYNAAGSPTTILYYDREGNAWVLSSKFEYTYDSRGNLNMYSLSMWDGADNQWTLYTRIRTESTYNTAGYVTSQTTSNWIIATNQWMNLSKNDYDYNATGQEIVSIYSEWNMATNQWLPKLRTESTYNAAGYVATETAYERNTANTAWVNDTKDTYTYDANGNVTLNIYAEWNPGTSQWVNWERIEYAFDLTYSRTDLLLPHFSTLPYLLELPGNKPLTTTTSDWVNNAWRQSERTTYYFSQVDVTSVDTPTPETIRIYPNPVSDYLSLNLPGTYRLIRFELYDMQGRTLISKDVSPGERISVAPLANGIYLYTITTDGRQHHGKLVKE